MKRILLSAATILMGAGAAFSQNVSLVEEFTQASCPPCEASTPLLNSTLEANEDIVVQLRYQTSWPGVDPMNADNPSEVADRVAYYQVGGVPSLHLNGTVPTGPVFPELVTQANLDSGFSRETPLSIELTHELSEDLQTVSIVATITNNGTEEYSSDTDKLRIAGVEEKIVWPEPPGSTSITVFDAVMKKFFGGTAGLDIPAIAAGESYEVTLTDEAMPSQVYFVLEFAVVAFVQDDSDQFVLAAGHSSPIAIEGLLDVSIVNNTDPQTTAATCEVLELAPAFTVENNGGTEITELEIEVTIGSQVSIESWSGSIPGGESANVQLDGLELPAGTNATSFVVQTVNGTGDANALNNNASGGYYSSFSPTSVGETMDESFENGGVSIIPGNSVVDWPIAEGAFGFGSFTLRNVAGPNGNTNAVFVNCYQWNPAESIAANEGSMTFQKLDLTNISSPIIEYSRSGARYQTSNDRLQILVSTDCGGTYDIVHDISGADLSTVDTHTEALFAPTAANWETDIVDLSAYSGMDEVMIQFKVLSDWGNSLFIDDIRVMGSTAVTEIEDASLANVSPNPVSTIANVDINVASTSDVSLVVMDMMGQVVSNQSLGNFVGQRTIAYDVTPMANGTYVFKVIAGDKVRTQKVSVIK